MVRLLLSGVITTLLSPLLFTLFVTLLLYDPVAVSECVVVLRLLLLQAGQSSHLEAVRTSIAASAAAYGQEGQPAQGTPQPPLMTAPALVQEPSDAMVGRLGAAALGTSTLANSFYGMMVSRAAKGRQAPLPEEAGVSVVWGGAAGMETLVGQAWGAGDLRVVRVVLLRALLVCWALSSLIVVLWQQALPLMLALGQNPGMAAAGARYLQALGPSLFVYVLAECLQSFLVATGNVRPTTLAKGVTAVLGPPLYFLLMFKCGLGLEGAAYAYACCKLVNALLLVGWIAWRGDALLQPPQPHSHSPSQPAASSSSSSSITTYLDKAGGEKGGSSNSGQADLRQRLLPPLAEAGPEAAAAVDHMTQVGPALQGCRAESELLGCT
ncbi:hypothetical protein QJQ45_009743 [Haematococcus lacustris]|nr:hypothetical protein QJQ45_009743 [Haematococcus lacustris]